MACGYHTARAARQCRISSVPDRHRTASTHHPCGVLCVSLCAAFPFQNFQSLSCQCSFPPPTANYQRGGNSAAMRAPAVCEGELCNFLQTRAHTPTSQVRSLLAAVSPQPLFAMQDWVAEPSLSRHSHSGKATTPNRFLPSRPRCGKWSCLE